MMKKRVTAFILVIVMTFAMASACLAADNYWSYLEDYQAALAADDPDAIISCVKRLENIYANPTTETEYERLSVPLERCGKEYEEKSMYSEACQYYQKSYACFKWLNDNGIDYYDKLLSLSALIEQLQGYFEVYTESSSPSDTPYYDAVNEPVNGTYYGLCDAWLDGNQSSKLVYAYFFDENIKQYDYLFPKTSGDYVVELAWNLPPAKENKEWLDAINTGEYDDYIISNLQYLASKGCKILLRFGAEINCWGCLPQTSEDAAQYGEDFRESFINAFRRVANYTHQYAPNCAMVYSPNDISNRNFDLKYFYPGDNYVDWVGLSTYVDLSDLATYTADDGNDAYYCRGLYENKLIILQQLVDDFGGRKPIMISECGFSFASDSSNQTEAHALAAQKYFLTYVNMVYPQVKALFYFNAESRVSGTKYNLTGSDGSKALLDQYLSVTKSNVSMQATIDRGDAKYYTKLSSFNETATALKLYTYAYYPGNNTTTVTYTLDGQTVSSSSQYPYEYTLSNLTVGVHKLAVTMKCGNTTQTKYYGICVGEDGRISTCISKVTDMSQSDWSYSYVAYCMHYGIFQGMTPTTFEPKTSISRGMFVTVLGRLAGVDKSQYTESDFSDVKANSWYSSYVQWAKENGIVNGTTSTTFNPDDSITREQICTILIRFCNKYNISLKQKDGSLFADDADISSYAKDPVYISKSNGIVNGRENNIFDPTATATRAEAAAIFARFKQNIYN